MASRLQSRLIWSVVTAALLCGGCAAGNPTATRSITVHGRGCVNTKPDALVLTITVSHTDDDINEARRQASETSGRLLDAIKPFTIDPDKSHTSRFVLEPNLVWERNHYEAYGYEVSQNLRVHLSDLRQAEDLTLAVLKTGVTSVHSEFVSKSEKELWPRARERALLDARRRAEQMAAVLGQRLGAPLKILSLDEETGLNIFGGSGGQWHDDDSAPSMPSIFEDRLNWMPPTYVHVEAYVRVEFSLLPD
jgi:uncharacterized protein YggE